LDNDEKLIMYLFIIV